MLLESTTFLVHLISAIQGNIEILRAKFCLENTCQIGATLSLRPSAPELASQGTYFRHNRHQLIRMPSPNCR